MSIEWLFKIRMATVKAYIEVTITVRIEPSHARARVVVAVVAGRHGMGRAMHCHAMQGRARGGSVAPSAAAMVITAIEKWTP